MSDLTTFLAKSGLFQPQSNLENAEISKFLMTPEEEEEFQNCIDTDLMEEMEKIITKMDLIMSRYKDVTIKKTASTNDLLLAANEIDPSVIGRLVAEISDLIHAQATTD